MLTLAWSPEARSQYDRIKQDGIRAQEARERSGKTKSSKQEGLFKQIHKALGYLASNPKHPSLQTHKFGSIADPSGKKRDVFEAYAQNDSPGAYRIFWCYGPANKQLTIIAITSHP